MMSAEVDLIRLWRLDCEGRGISELVIKHYENYLREYRRDARPLLGSTTFDLSSFLLERSGRWAPATRMTARLSEGDAADWGEVHRHVPSEGHVVDEHSGRLEVLLDDPTATDGEIERAIADLRIARSKADVALKIASFANAPTQHVADQPQPV